MAIPLPDIASKADEISKRKKHKILVDNYGHIFCNNSKNNDTSQHASTNNRIGIQYNNLKAKMGVRPTSL